VSEKPPSATSIAIATILAAGNGIWTALLLGGAVAYGAMCDSDFKVGQQDCQIEAISWGVLWLFGQILLAVPTGWSAHVLVWAERERPPSMAVRIGLLGVAATLSIPIGLLFLGLVAGSQ
jgi:hypothetical protein